MHKISFHPNKDKLFCPVFVFRRGMSNVICYPMLYLQNEGFKHFMNISRYNFILVQRLSSSLATSHYDGLIRDLSKVSLGKSDTFFKIF